MSNKKDDISQFEVLVSSAGGIAGYRQLGVLLEIWPTIKPTVHSFVGTSIGAIINLFLNLDFTPREIIELTLNTNLMSEDFISKDKALSNHGLIDNEKF
jgi:predicted acylesterase/phospholipase RssA